MLSWRKVLTVAMSLTGVSRAYTNPIRNPGGGDPQISYTGGYYYLISTEWTNLQLSRATTIEGLKTAVPKVIYTETDPSRNSNVWAPELHYLGGLWYIYYTAGTSKDLTGQRSHVLKGGSNPWDFSFAYAARLTDDWGIDGTVLRTNQFGNYFVYSCQTGVKYQSTCIRKLGANFISAGPVSIISQPDQAWEKAGTPVQEGPNALYFGGKTYIAYSANYCWTANYCVALLEWTGGDPAVASSWRKSNGCVLKSANGSYGTGHNSFFQSPDGKQTFITFHATSNPNGACDDTRYAMTQPLTANSNGTPNFGAVMPLSHVFAEPSR